MEYYIETLDYISTGTDAGGKYMRCTKSIRPLRTNLGVWYYPVYGWLITPGYRTEFTSTVSVSTQFSESSTVDFYLCGPVDQNYYTVDVDRNTGVPNLPIIAQASIYNPGDSGGGEESTGNTVTASLNIGSGYGGTELAANETYILFFVRTGANTSDGAVIGSFNTITITDDSPAPAAEEWSIFHAPWYDSVDTSGYTVSNLFLPAYNLLCFPIDHESKDGSWTVEISAGANAVVYVGTSYRWDSTRGVPVGTRSSPGTNFTVSDISATMNYIWVRFSNGSSGGNVSITISFMETHVETQWHAHVPTISMNGGNVLPDSGSETWTSGLGEKEVLIYRFKLSENSTPTFSYSGTKSMWMCISTVSTVNSQNGAPDPSSAIRGQGNGTNISFSASTELTAQTWYYLFVEVSNGEEYNGQIVITYQTRVTPPVTEWTYNNGSAQTDILVETTPEVALTAHTGILFQASFRFNGTASFSVSGSAYVYATSGNYGYSRSSGTPYDINGNELLDGTSTSINVAAGYTYYVWVRGQNADTAGTVTVTITPPPVLWTEVEAGQKNVTVTDEEFTESYPLSIQQTMVYRYDITFSRSGTVRIYSTGSTVTSDVVAYFSEVLSAFDRTSGRPENYDAVWYDTGSGNYNFNSGEITVAAGTYHLWVRGEAADTTASIAVNISGGTPSGGKMVWIYTINGWKQSTPWVYTANGWKQATPWIYTSSGWKQTT